MLRLAEYIDPTPSPVWRLAQQCGVTAAVGGAAAGPVLSPGVKPATWRVIRIMEETINNRFVMNG